MAIFKASKEAKAHLLLFSVALIYGANYSIAKIILDPGLIDPNTFILLRIGTGLFLLLLFYGKPIAIERKDWKMVIYFSVTGILTNQLFFFNGLARTSPIHASLIMITTPILVFVIHSIWKRNPINWEQWFGCILGFTGTLWLVLSSAPESQKLSSLVGDIMIFINAVSYSLYLSSFSSLSSKYGTISLLTWIFLIGFFLCLPISYQGLLDIPFNQFELKEWASLMFVLIATTFLAYLFNAQALEYSSAALVSNYIYLQPFIAFVIALMLHKDQWRWEYAICAMLIFSGLILVSRQKSF